MTPQGFPLIVTVMGEYPQSFLVVGWSATPSNPEFYFPMVVPMGDTTSDRTAYVLETANQEVLFQLMGGPLVNAT